MEIKDKSSSNEELVLIRSLKRNGFTQTQPTSNLTKRGDKNAERETSAKNDKHNNRVKRKKLT